MKPTALLEASGAFKKNPQLRRVDPKSQGDIGDPPGYMVARDDMDTADKARAKALKAIWKEIVDDAPEGVLTRADRIAVELICDLTWKFRTFGVGGQYGLSGACVAQLKALLGSIGFTPADRAKVATAPINSDDSLKEFD